MMIMSRSSYEESCLYLHKCGYLESGDPPPMPSRPPRADDAEPLGVGFFRTILSDELPLKNLTLPRTFFGRSEIRKTCFQNTDLTESNLCWNDFAGVDFSGAVLAKADMRASQFMEVTFAAADLRGADMRRSFFERCNFDGALLSGTVFTPDQDLMLSLTSEQREAIDWRTDPGEEPSGG